MGESLAREGVNVIAMYGGTEFGPVTSLLPGRQERSPEDWSYMRFSSALNVRMVAGPNGTLESQYLVSGFYIFTHTCYNLVPFAGHGSLQS